MNTFFAAPERENGNVIAEQVKFASNNPVVDAILNTSGGIIAVLNEKRQIVAVNETLLSFLSVSSRESVLGLRPGEVLNCAHAYELEAGCGTSSWCSTCGAAIAIVASLADKKPVERKCSITVKNDDTLTDLCFSVRSATITLENQSFVLLYIHDISAEEQRASLERMFNHDIKNLLTGITCSAEMLECPDPAIKDSIVMIQRLSIRLRSEILLHASFFGNEETRYAPVFEELKLQGLCDELAQFFSVHYSSVEKSLKIQKNIPDCTISTDYSLIMRVLTNLLINAFEATPMGGTVRLSAGMIENAIVFEVWNRTFIPPEISKRVFQQYFSTKKGNGRGFGSFGSKYICERLLKGTLQFNSIEAEGTTFTVVLPVSTE